MAAIPKREVLNRLAKVGPTASARSAGAKLEAASQLEKNKTPPEPGSAVQPRALLTIAEAARRLGTDKTRLREALSYGEIAHKLVAKSDTLTNAIADQPPTPLASAKGVRVPAELLDELRPLLDRLSSKSSHGDQHPAVITEPALASPLAVIGDTAHKQDDQVAALELKAEWNGSGEDQLATGQSIIKFALAPQARQAESAPLMTIASPDPQPQATMPLSLTFERLLMEKDARIDDLKAEIVHLREMLEREQGSHARTQTLLRLQIPPLPPASENEMSATRTKPEPATSADPLPQLRRGILQWFTRRVPRA